MAGRPLATDGEVVAGRLLEPYGLGFPLLIAPAYSLGGAKLVTVLLAAVAALAFVLAAALARRVVPEPWATWAALLAGLSPPALAAATAVTPALLAGALLAAASLCALAVRERPLMRTAFGGGAALAVLPWLDPWLLVPAAPVALLLARWTARRGRAVVALGTVEIQLASLVFYVSLNDRLYGGFTPLAVADEPVTGAASAADYADRVPRLVSLWLDERRACCAGRPCSRSRSSAPGCCGARAASASAGSWPSSATPSTPRSSSSRYARRRCWSRRSRCRARRAGRGARRRAALRGPARGVGAAARAARRAGRWARSRWPAASGSCAGGPWVAPASDAPWGPLAAAFPRGDVAALVLGLGLGAACAWGARVAPAP